MPNPRRLKDEVLDQILVNFFQSEVPESLRALAPIDDLAPTSVEGKSNGLITAANVGEHVVKTSDPKDSRAEIVRGAGSSASSPRPTVRIASDATTPRRVTNSRSLAVPGIVAACLALGVVALIQPPRPASLDSDSPSVVDAGGVRSEGDSHTIGPAATARVPDLVRSPDAKELAQTSPVPQSVPGSAVPGSNGSEEVIRDWTEEEALVIASRPADAGDAFAPFSIREHVEPVERAEFQTQDGPVELQSQRNILQVQFDDPETGSYVQMTIPELDIQVMPLGEFADRK